MCVTELTIRISGGAPGDGAVDHTEHTVIKT